MLKRLSLTTLLLTAPVYASAGEADNIMACISSVKLFSGKIVDEFDVRYTGRILGMSSAEWKGVKCSVKLGYIDELTVDGKQYIVDGFAGIEAKRSFDLLEKETGDAISLLESRVELLQRRLDQAKSRLKEPDPDIPEITAKVRDGIGRATGN